MKMLSPPRSPREEGEQEVPSKILSWGLLEKIDVDTIHRKSRNEKETAQIFKESTHKKNMTKYHRRMGKLKQPGGASCNQRR